MMKHAPNLLRGLLLAVVLGGPAPAGVIFSDDFDNINAAQWSLTSFVGARGNGLQGFDTGNALHFAGFGTRAATTIALDVSGGGTVQFDFRGGNEDIDGSTYWEDVDFGENAVLEYSTDGVNFVAMGNLDLVQFRNHSPTTNWLSFSAAVPTAAQSASTRFRWRQLRHSGWLWDEWAIDNVVITAVTPEPSTLVLLCIGAIGAVFVRRRREPLVMASAGEAAWPERELV